MAKKAYIGVDNTQIVYDGTLEYADGSLWGNGEATIPDSWTRKNVTANVEIDGVLYSNATFNWVSGETSWEWYGQTQDGAPCDVFIDTWGSVWSPGGDGVSHHVKVYIGTPGGVARKIKKGYIGIGNVARKIKKAYIGIGGVARPCWSGGKLTYYGEVDPLYAAGYAAGAPAGNYLVICSVNKTATAYDKSFTRYQPATINVATVVASTLNGAAIFLGGISSGSASVTRYDASLTKTNPFTLREALTCHGARELNNCLLYAGGGPSSEYPRRDCVRVDASFTQTSLAQLTNIAYRCSSATNGKQAFFSCGYNPWNGQTYRTIDYYNESFVKGVAPDLTDSGSWGVGVSHGNLAVFCLSNGYTDYYDTSVTKGKAENTAQGRSNESAGFHLGGCALITGENTPAIVDCYDENMVHTTPFPSLSIGGYNYSCPAGVANEEIGMFAGGGSIANVFAFVVA